MRLPKPVAEFVCWFAASSLAKGASVAFLLSSIGAVVAYLLHVLLARWLGADEYGTFAYVTSWASLLAAAAAGGFPMTLLRFASEYRSMEAWALLRGLLTRLWLLVLAAGVALALTAEGIRAGLSTESVAEISDTAWHLGIWTVPLLALLHLQAEAGRSLERVALAYSPLRVWRSLLTIFGVGALVISFGRPSSEHALLFLLLVSAALVVLQAVLLARAFPAPVRRATPEFQTRGWLVETLPFLVGAFSFHLMEYTGVLVVGTVSTPEQAGIYNVAVRTAALIAFILAAVTTVLAPRFASLHAAGHTEALPRLSHRAAHGIFWPSLAAVGALILVGRGVLGVFGPAFGAAYIPLVIISCGHLVSAGVGPVGHLLYMTGRQRQAVRAIATVALLNVAVMIAVVPRGGLIGAAVVSALSVALWSAWLHVLVVREMGFSPSIVAALRTAARG